MPRIQLKLKQNKLSDARDIMSLNKVHEPRNAEFKAFLGSFWVT